MKLLNIKTIEQVNRILDENFGQSKMNGETIGFTEAEGRFLSEDIFSKIDMPEFDKSVVDGFAVVASDTFGASEGMPTFLNVTGSVEIGETFDRVVKENEAVYVPTGGMIPKGADAVVMIEYVEHLDDSTIAVSKAVSPRDGILACGDDFKSGEKLFSKGKAIRSKDIGVLAAIGKARLEVFSKPKVAIISTGNEIVDVGEATDSIRVRDINRYVIMNMLKAIGCEVNNGYIVKDQREELKESMARALAESDVVILSGGSSAGVKDMTCDVIDDLGDPGVLVHGVAIKPGKPTIVGNVGGKPVFGLPGHPVSAAIVYKAVVEKFIKRNYYSNFEEEQHIWGTSTVNIHSSPGKETYQMVSIEEVSGKIEVTPVYRKSGAISLLMRADGYIRIDENEEGIVKGADVKVYFLR